MLKLSYKLASLDDFENLYHIKCDERNIAWGGFLRAPVKETFYQWYSKQLESDSRWIYLVYENNICCAFFYIDKLRDDCYEATSSGVLSEFMGKGIGTYSLASQVVEIDKKMKRGGGDILLDIRQQYCLLQTLREARIHSYR